MKDNDEGYQALKALLHHAAAVLISSSLIVAPIGLLGFVIKSTRADDPLASNSPA